MRPPLTSSTLQQNEVSRQQIQQQQFQTKTSEKLLQQQSQQQRPQQQQFQIARKIKSSTHDSHVENHLNLACSTQPPLLIATHAQPFALARKSTATHAPTHSALPTAAAAASHSPTQQTYQANEEKKLFESYHDRQRDIRLDIDDLEVVDLAEAQLVDLSTSPPPSKSQNFKHQAASQQQSRSLERFHAVAAEQYQSTSAAQNDTNAKRASILSDCQYSTQSSASSDDVSFNFNSNLDGYFHHQQKQQQQHTRANSFDDAAKHFIINFPGDSFLPQNHQQPNDCIINLPLSETAPLLTNIEATVNDKQRSICLNKNSASLIFTKKELPIPPPRRQPQLPPAVAAAGGATSVNEWRFLTPITNNNQQASQPLPAQQLHALTNKHSTNVTNPKLYLNTQRRCHSLYANHSTPSAAATAVATSNSILTSTSTSTKRRPTKHLPASYHQQQRRSLQLNYNNNLVTTSTCSASNNNCCPSTAKINSNSAGANAALHRHHHQQQQQKQQNQQHSQDTPKAILPTTGVNENRTTATATRKQHAYSWYAPVYSALEEELEQDSRDSSPIRNNLANTKKHLTATHYPHRTSQKHTSSVTSTDNETVALLETRNQINIQAQLHAQAQQQQQHQAKSGSSVNVSGGGGLGVGAGAGALGIGITSEGLPAAQRKGNASAQALTLQLNNISGGSTGSGVGVAGALQATQQQQNYDTEVGPHAGSLGLAGGPLPRRKRLENLEKFFKSLVGLRPSSNNNNTNSNPNNNNNVGNGSLPAANIRGHSNGLVESSPNPMPLPSSPEIRITRTPSDQNVDMSESERQLLRRSQDKLAAPQQSTQQGGGGSTSSLNVVQQKIWNIIRRDGSAASLYQDKSQSLVHYSGLRKCETVLALTSRQGQTPNGGGCLSPHQAPYMGSGVFSPNGVEQIRPLNRLRNSTASINNAATCSRCSSLLSLAATGSRYSLNAASNGFVPSSASQQLLTPIPATPPTFHLGSQATSQQQQQAQQHQRRYTASGMVRRFSFGSRRSRSVSNSSREDTPTETNAATATATTQATATTVPQRKISTTSCSSSISFVAAATANAAVAALPKRKISTCSCSSSSGVSCSRKSSAGAQSTTTTNSSSISPPLSNQTTATLNSSLTPTTVSTAAVGVATAIVCESNAASLNNSLNNSPTFTPTVNSNNNNNNNNNNSTSIKIKQSPGTADELLCVPLTTTTQASPKAREMPTHELQIDVADGAATTPTDNKNEATTTTARPFEMFTCKLCLIDVECVKEATTLIQCGCQFCTECMKAYIEFEISEGAYEISCPDAQCPAQGVITLTEIANLTTANLMKKHHRYRLNREIELDKTRTWCPRAGCETVCRVGGGGSGVDCGGSSAPSTSTAASNTPTSPLSGNGGDANAAAQQLRCSVICPSCKDEFCSACKKTWHPNMTCEENSRRLVADGQDDIGIPFDNDLIKCCPMCAVPIEKDEGCAQMMCKRCKHVFCWYCLASLDDDFLLRHYDKGPCKNKLGHSRASVVWHRAQVIGIFAGFGILLLVASPLLLLAAPCIICCKCRSCSSKIDEGDADLEEATQLQSF